MSKTSVLKAPQEDAKVLTCVVGWILGDGVVVDGTPVYVELVVDHCGLVAEDSAEVLDGIKLGMAVVHEREE